GWYAAAMMPTAEAFAPVHSLQKRMLLATFLMTLLAGALTWFMLKRQLLPALTTIKTLATLADADQTPAPLPITRQDEIGELIGGFNRLLETLGKREEALRERVKELSCLYSITDLLAENNHIEEVLQKIVNQIPSGWYYPEQACARIILHNKEFTSTNFQETAWKLSARIMDSDKALGVVEVHYREKIPDRCEDPFLEEERSLISAIAEHLGKLISRKATEEELAIKQRQLQTLNETLAAQVAEEVLKNRGKDILLLHQDKLAGIGQLAGGVAHEINNPMGFIISNLVMLKKYSDVEQKYRVALENALEESCPEERRKQLGDLRQALDLPFVLKDIPLLISESLGGAERIKRIVLDLKDFARIDQGKMNQTDLNQCVQSTANIVRNEIRHVAELELQLNEIPLVVCNSQQINQVIANLLINAGQAMDKHGAITVTSRQEREEVVLSISDTGRGMTEEVRKRIFEPFFTTRNIGQGTGLGLSIAYGIIKQHDGEITVESEPGEGTTFTIRLPIKRA
ncbi:MAG: ATP-binding protein, partial [Deltaproteobacteria bacterium]